MGIQDHMQEVDREDTIHIGVWKGSSGAIRILGTQSASSNNYQHDRKRCSIGEVKSTNGNGRGQDSGRISLGSTESKGQILGMKDTLKRKYLRRET
jgi:hypothetical protein